MLQAENAAPRPGMIALAAGGRLARRSPQALGASHIQYVSPDGTTFIPAGAGLRQRRDELGREEQAVLRGFGLAKASPGKPAYITDEAEITTYAATITPDGAHDAV